MSEYTIASHFEGKDPIVATLYAALLSRLRQFGAVQESAKKTSIHLDHANGFAGVYTQKKAIQLHFRLDHRVEHSRISKIEQQSAHRFMHIVKLEQVADLDTELLEWLHQAYQLAG